MHKKQGNKDYAFFCNEFIKFNITYQHLAHKFCFVNLLNVAY